MTITREQYLDTQAKIMDLAAQLGNLPLEEFIEALRQVEAVDPNFAVVGHTAAFAKRLAEGALIFKRCAPEGFRFIPAVTPAAATAPPPPRQHAVPITPPIRSGASKARDITQPAAEEDEDDEILISAVPPPATRPEGARGSRAY